MTRCERPAAVAERRKQRNAIVLQELGLNLDAGVGGRMERHGVAVVVQGNIQKSAPGLNMRIVSDLKQGACGERCE